MSASPGTRRAASTWVEKAAEAAGRIDTDHTAPWKLATAYALLAIAEEMVARPRPGPIRQRGPVDRRQHDAQFLTVAEVSAMARIPVGTLRYWRHTGSSGPPSVKLGRRVLYRRTDVETWLKEAR